MGKMFLFSLYEEGKLFWAQKFGREQKNWGALSPNAPRGYGSGYSKN